MLEFVTADIMFCSNDLTFPQHVMTSPPLFPNIFPTRSFLTQLSHVCAACVRNGIKTAMEKESEGLLKSLDAQAEKISDQVLRRVLPEGVKV